MDAVGGTGGEILGMWYSSRVLCIPLVERLVSEGGMVRVGRVQGTGYRVGMVRVGRVQAAAALVLGGSVLGGSVLGGSVLGSSVLGARVLGDRVLGGSVLGGSVLGGSVLGGSVLGSSVLGGSVLGARVAHVLPPAHVGTQEPLVPAWGHELTVRRSSRSSLDGERLV